MTQEIVAVLIAISGVLSIMTGYLTATRKRDVEDARKKTEELEKKVSTVLMENERCHAALQTMEKLVAESEQRSIERVQELLIKLAVRDR